MTSVLDAATVRSLTADRHLAPHAPPDALADLSATEAAVVFRLLPTDESVEVFDALDRGTRSDIIDALHTQELSSIFSDLDPEDQGRLVDELPANVTAKLL